MCVVADLSCLALQVFLNLVEVKESSNMMPGEYLKPEVCRIEEKKNQESGE